MIAKAVGGQASMISRLRPGLSTTLAALVALAPASARATTAGPVTELSASPANAAQRAPALAFDGTRYVMVWEDERSAATSGVDLYLARIGLAGELLDPNGLPVSNPAISGNQTQPQLVYNAIGLNHLIVWTDGRNTDSNIWAARFLAGSGTVIEQAGFQVSSDTAPEAQPALACTVQSCMFLWQAAIGGAFEVRGRRTYADGTPLDPSGLALSASAASNQSKPRVISIGSTFFATWEDDRNAATTGLDLFARTIPELDPFSPETGVVITSAALRQTESDLAPLGPAGIAVVWQDQRNGVLVDDVYARTFDTQLGAGSADLHVSGAAEDQLRPRIAGDASRGLVVWQDRRSGAYGFTYGARLDSGGALRDPDGFPLLVASSNVFEHAVTKGPAGDYLVAAVRFDGTPRILYRIVRDEPPAGTMTPAGTTSVPADGASVAHLTFGPARGATAPGFPVVDGTLYTVALSRADVLIDLPDRDPNLAGHQVFAIDGQVSFGLSSLAHGTVDVDVVSVEGSSVGAVTVTFENVPPTVTDVLLQPPAPSSSEDLLLTYAYFDLNSDLESGTTIEWTRNAAIQAGLANQLTVPASATTRGDQWRARVTPRDGLNSGAFVFSNTITIGNTPPSAAGVRIDPATGVKTGTALRGRFTFVDDDNDAQAPQTALRWFERDAEVTTLAGVSDVPGAMVRKGQLWRFEVEPHDGVAGGAPVSSAPVTVENTGPIADAGQNGVVVERRRFRLDGTGSSDVDPQDVLTYAWTQVAGPEVTLSDTSSATPSFEAPSVPATVIVQLELRVSDGEETSPADRVVVEISPVTDRDADGLDDEEELAAGTDPMLADTDRDGLQDRPELESGTDPNDEDSDDDGVRDGAEGRACPDCAPDPANDADLDLRIAALDPDGDGDGLLDGTELGVRAAIPGTNEGAGAFQADLDPETTTDPTRSDTDGDGVPDGVEDTSRDGRLDDGESDPNDPADPEVACTPGQGNCPPGTSCEGGVCRVPSATDGGLTCRPLEELGVECCMGGCTGGTEVAPVCRAQGQLEQCPVAAMQCAAGSCSAEPPPPPGGGSSGCGCTAERGSSGAALELLLAALALLSLRARRRVG